MALGGAAGARLSRKFGIETSEPTMLRQLRSSHAEIVMPAPRVVGVDDWAWRKGHRYGTTLCDLERGRVIDMLADRSSASTEQWMRQHSGIEIVSRDRASLYAEAAGKALPHSVQVADRWHLLRNLGVALTELLASRHHLLHEAAQAVHPELPFPPPEEVRCPAAGHRAEAAKQRNRERRLNRYQQVMEKLRQGISQAAAARLLGLDRRTVHRWSQSRGFPERKPVQRRSSVDRYRSYLCQRWDDGCRNSTQLWRELREQGFDGQRNIVYDWLRRNCGPMRSGPHAHVCGRPARVSPRHSAWQIHKNPEESRVYLDEVFRRSPEIATCAAVAGEFVRMIRERDAAAWKPWLASALRSPLAGFARHLRRDESAVLAALKTRWSNGPVEGYVHRLKLIKRSIYVCDRMM